LALTSISLVSCTGGAFSGTSISGQGSTVGGTSQPPPGSAQPPGSRLHIPSGRYVALGDSFSSGEGAATDNFPFYPGTDTKGPIPIPGAGGNGCHRTDNAYPVLLSKLDAEAPKIAREDFVACSGAVLKDLLLPNRDNAGEPPQLLRLDELRNDTAGLVTMSMSGNDVNFPGIIKNCLQRLVKEDHWYQFSLLALKLGTGSCQEDNSKDLGARLLAIDGTSPQNVPAGPSCGMHCDAANLCPPEVFASDPLKKCNPYNLIQIYETLRVRAPYARILIIGYPREFKPDQNGACQHIDHADLNWANSHITDALDEVIKKNIDAANSVGAGVEYVDTVPSFTPHPQWCGPGPDPGGSGFNGVTPALAVHDKEGFFHPNELGHKLVAQAVLHTLEKPSAFTLPARPDPSRACPPTPCTVTSPNGAVRITVSRVYQYPEATGGVQLPPLPGAATSNEGTFLHMRLVVVGNGAVNLDLLSDFTLVSSTGDTSVSRYNEDQKNSHCPGGGNQSSAVLGPGGSFDGPLCFNAQQGTPAAALEVGIAGDDFLIPLR
jgi:lysophospholipase L1-like esterase